jgi:hypothetical protein
MFDPFLAWRLDALRPSLPWFTIVKHPPSAGVRDVCALWHGVHSDNDEPDGPRYGDAWGMGELVGPSHVVDGWRIVAPEDAGRSRAVWWGA